MAIFTYPNASRTTEKPARATLTGTVQSRDVPAESLRARGGTSAAQGDGSGPSHEKDIADRNADAKPPDWGEIGALSPQQTYPSAFMKKDVESSEPGKTRRVSKRLPRSRGACSTY